MKNVFGMAAIVAIAGTASADVIITGIMDGPLSGGTPKAIELYVDGTVDFAGYSFLRSSNGGSWGTTTDISSLGTVTDSFVYLVGSGSSVSSFQNIFGTSGDFANMFVSGNVSLNGNDGFRIVNASSVVIDQVWEQNDTISHQDSYMYRVDGTGADGANWISSNWMIPGNDVLDNLNEAAIAAAVPFGTYQVPSPGAVSLLGLSGLMISKRRRA